MEPPHNTVDRSDIVRLLAHGDIIRLSPRIDLAAFDSQVKAFDRDWVRYNPHKLPNNRWGLSLTSLDGGMSGVPDLTSIREYNLQHGTEYRERDFSTPTAAYHALTCLHPLLVKLAPLGRTHIIRLDTGGFFPPHRDGMLRRDVAGTLRVLVPLHQHLTSEEWAFIYEDRLVQFVPGAAYFVNTWKAHSVFSFRDHCLLLVVNLPVSVDAVDRVLDLFSYK